MPSFSKLILLACRLQLSDSEIEEINTLVSQISDWDKTIQLAIARQAGPFLYQKLMLLPEKLIVPVQALESLRQSYLKTLSRNMVLAVHFQQLATALNNEKYPCDSHERYLSFGMAVQRSRITAM